MKMKQNILDEMQERKLTKIEGTGFWLVFWGLLTAIIIQVLIHPDLKQIAGELAIFFAMSIYLVILCLKNGLWSKTPAPTTMGNLISSVLAALALGAVMVLRSLISNKGFSSGFAGTLLLFAAVVFGGCFATLEVMRAVYQRRRRRLDGEAGDEEAH